MSSILNSISTGNLQVQNALRESTGVNNVLKKSEIEFATCTRQKKPELTMSTGFGANNSLHYSAPCKKKTLKTPLYLENYLQEFKTEEEKAAVRHSLGLYNKGDVVAMSLLTAEDHKPSVQEILQAEIKQLRKGDKLFHPITITDAVYDQQGNRLSQVISQLTSTLNTQNNELLKITQVSKLKNISSLGDVKLFLKGFTKEDNLYNSLEQIKTEMLRFEEITI